MKTLPSCLGFVRASEQQLVKSFTAMARRHRHDFEIREGCKLFAQWSQAHLDKLEGFDRRHGVAPNPDPARVRRALFHGARIGGYGLLRDLQDLLLLVHQTRTAWTGLIQAAKEMRETDMADQALNCGGEADRQIDWLCTHIKVAAPQALTVPPNLAQEIKDSAASTIDFRPSAGVLVAGVALGVMSALLLNLRR